MLRGQTTETAIIESRQSRQLNFHRPPMELPSTVVVVDDVIGSMQVTCPFADQSEMTFTARRKRSFGKLCIISIIVV